MLDTLELKDLEIHKIYQVNICSAYELGRNRCFFFVYFEGYKGYKFWSTRAFPFHWKKHLSKKLIDYLLTLEYYYWFSINCMDDLNIEEKICGQFLLYPPIFINIREYNV